MANYYNNFAHTAHHIRKVYIFRKDAYLLFFFFLTEKINIFNFFYTNKESKNRKVWIVYRLFELSWHKVLVEESVSKINFYLIKKNLIN